MKRVLTVILACLLLLCSIGCSGPERQKGKVKLSFWAGISEANQEAYTQAIQEFQKQNPDIIVRLVPQSSDFSSDLSGALRGNSPPDIVMVEDRYFKRYVSEGYLTKLDDFISGSDGLALEDMFESLYTRFSYNAETGYSGQGQDYYAVPSGGVPSLIYYNVTQFNEQNINIVSAAEKDLDSYNSQNNAQLLPHGYYVYDTAPVPGMKAGADGKYHVFNNRIPMNWDELIALSRLFTRSCNPSSPSRYGFLNEWWFSFGWSVGGDCLEWDDTKDQYIFALGNDDPGYLVTGNGLTVNGTAYSAGEVLGYADKRYVAEHKQEQDIAAAIADGTLYPLPSTRDAFAEFCRLSQKTGKEVTAGKAGYGISPSPTTLGNNSKFTYFTTGEVAMVCDNLDTWQVGKNMEVLGKEWDVAPLYQYREYNADGTLKTVNGTPVTGLQGTHSISYGYAVPANSKNQEAAWKFIRFMAGEEGQSIMMKSGTIVPNQKALARSEAYLTDGGGYSPANKSVLVDMIEIGHVGDWSYVEDGEWVNVWANILNTKVRDGDMTLDEFFENSTVKSTDDVLKKYRAKKYR